MSELEDLTELIPKPGSWVSAISTAPAYGLDDRGVGVRIPIGSRIFPSPRRPDRLWGPPNLVSNGHRRLFPRGQSDVGVKLTNHFQLLSTSRKRGCIHPLPHTPSRRSAKLVRHRDNFINTQSLP
jgi:hypothetical protein